MPSPFPSLIVSGQPYPFRAVDGNTTVDLSRAAQISAHPDTNDWIVWDPPAGYSIVAPFRHPEVDEYLKSHYCPLGIVWVNPARVTAISKQEGKLIVLYGPQFQDTVPDGYTAKQMADAVRKAGLTHTQNMDCVALKDVLVFDAVNSAIRMGERYSGVETQRHEALIAVMEASEWFFHEPNLYGNPHQAQMLIQEGKELEHIRYASDLSLSVSSFRKEAMEQLRSLPWFTVAPGKAINLANADRFVPQLGTSNVWVHMGNGITISCPSSVVKEIQERKQALQ